MPDLSGGTAFVEVMPSMRGYFQSVRREISGNPVQHRIEPTVDKSALDKARTQVEQAAAKVEAARKKEADAAGAARVAEAQLAEIRGRASARADQIVAAEERYQRALRNSEQATRQLDSAVAGQRTAASRVVRLETRFDAGDSDAQARSWLDRITGYTAGAAGAFDRAGQRMSSFADHIQGAAAGAGGALTAMGGYAFALASDWEQALGAIETVFEGQSGMMIGFAEGAANSVGLAKTEYAELANVLGASLKNMGVPFDQLGVKTNGLIGLGSDLAATYGGTTKEAVEALSSALRGETDPIERYGISIKQSTIDAAMAARGLSNLEGEAATLARTETLLSLVTEQSGGAIGAFARENGTAANELQTAKANIKNMATELGEALLPVVGDAAGALSGFAQFLTDNKWAAYAFMGVLGLLAAAFVVAKIAAIGFAIASAVAAAPVVFTVGLIVAAIALLIGGIVLLWKKNEGFRNAVKAVWEAILGFLRGAWNVIKGVFQWIWEALQWVGDKFVWLWQNVIQPAFTVIGTIISWVYQNVILPIFTAIKVAVAIVATAFVLLGMIFAAIWNAIVAVAQWAWNTILQPVFGAIMSVLGQVGAFFGWVWDTLIKPAWDALAAGIAWVWENIIRPAWDALKAALQAIGDFFVWVWNAIIAPAWNALGAGIAWVWDTVIRPTWELLKTALGAIGDFFSWVWNSVIKPVWDALGAGIAWVVDHVILPIWDTLKGALDLVGRSFETVVDWIGRVWDRIKAIAAKPVRFVVDTVYNNGIRAAWNKVAGWLKLPELGEAPLGELGNYARGGVLPGYTPGRDVHDFYSPSGLHIGLSGGEAILRPEAARALGPGGVDSINAAARVGGPEAVRRELGQYAGGGIVDSIVDKVHRFFPGMTITDTYRNSNDLHGQGKAVDFSNGTDTTPQMQAAARFFHDNYGPMLAELIHWPLAGWRNIDEGRPFDFGEPTNSQHRNHVHVAAHAPLPEPGTPITPIASGGGGGGIFGWLRNRVADAFEGVMNPIGNAIPDFGGGDIGRLPKLAFDKLKTGVGDFLRGKADEVEPSTGYADPGGGDVQRWRPLVEELLGLYGHPLTWTDLTLRRMGQESGGNPRAINNWDVNAANGTPSKGLMQVIDPTFRAYRDPAFVDDIWDPRANIAASMRYAMATYGSLPAAYNRAGGYDQGGIASGRGLMMKDVIRPERVLDPEMTRSFDDKLIPILERLTTMRPEDVLSAADRRALVSVDLSGAQIVGQQIGEQHIHTDLEFARESRRATKRALAESRLS